MPISPKRKWSLMRDKLAEARRAQGIKSSSVDLMMNKGTSVYNWERLVVPTAVSLITWADALGYDVKLVKREKTSPERSCETSVQKEENET